MLTLIKRLLMFRMGQKSARGAAKMLGFRKLAMVVGLVGGYRTMRKHS